MLLAAKRVCGGRACALGIRCDCVALQRAAAPSCWLQARRVQRAHRESNTGWAAGCNRIFNQGPPARRPGSAPAGVPRPGSAALRPVRWQLRAGNWPLGARRRQRVACILACVPVQVPIPANLNEFPGPCGQGQNLIRRLRYPGRYPAAEPGNKPPHGPGANARHSPAAAWPAISGLRQP